MRKELQKIKWDLHCKKKELLFLWGLKTRLIIPYNDKLIEKLRNIYYGGIPASIILLSDRITNGHCYDRALLMARAFLDDESDVKLLYATIDSLKLNPKFICKEPLYADHCIVERTTKDGRHFIYDTSAGFIYEKSLYWLIENPKVRKENDKEAIKKFLEDDKERYLVDINKDKYVAPLILPMIERDFGKPNEIYSIKGIELLQREIEYYKRTIKYNDIVKEMDQDMKRLGLKK